MEIISRDAAAQSGQRHYFTGRPCSKGHTGLRYTSTGNCKECQRAYSASYGAVLRSSPNAMRDSNRAELLPANIHLPAKYHAQVFQLIDLFLAQEGRPPCGYPKPDAPPAPPPDVRTPWERARDMHAMLGNAHHAKRMADLTGPETHSPGWAPGPCRDSSPAAPAVHLGGNKPSYL